LVCRRHACLCRKNFARPCRIGAKGVAASAEIEPNCLTLAQ
jgi:hypothetical protein